MAEEYFVENGRLPRDVLTYLSAFLTDGKDIASFRLTNTRMGKAATNTQLRHRIQDVRRNKEKQTILQFAAFHNDIDLVCRILNQPECTLNFINAGGERDPASPNLALGKTALMIATEKNHNDIVKLLLGCGANQNMENALSSRRTALGYAAAKGNVEVVRILAANNADPKHLSAALLEGFNNPRGDIHPEILTDLLEKGASFFNRISRSGHIYHANQYTDFENDARHVLRGLSEEKYYDVIKAILSNDRSVNTSSWVFQNGFSQQIRGAVLQYPLNYKQLIFCYTNLAAIFKGNDSEEAKQRAYNFFMESSERRYFDDAVTALLSCKNPAFFTEENKAQLRVSRQNLANIPNPFNNFPAALRRAIYAGAHDPYSFKTSEYQSRYHESLSAMYDSATNMALNPGDVHQQGNVIDTWKNNIKDLFKCQTSDEKRNYVATNLAFAISIIGLFILAIKALHSYYHTKRFLLFNHPTAHVAKELACLERAIPVIAI